MRKELLLLRNGYVRELASASYPHILCGARIVKTTDDGLLGEFSSVLAAPRPDRRAPARSSPDTMA